MDRCIRTLYKSTVLTEGSCLFLFGMESPVEYINWWVNFIGSIRIDSNISYKHPRVCVTKKSSSLTMKSFVWALNIFNLKSLTDFPLFIFRLSSLSSLPSSLSCPALAMVDTVATGVTSRLGTLPLDPMGTTRLVILLRGPMVTTLWDAHRQAQVVAVTMVPVVATVVANEPTQWIKVWFKLWHKIQIQNKQIFTQWHSIGGICCATA